MRPESSAGPLDGRQDAAEPAGSPFRGPGLAVRAVPFAVVAILAEASLALQPGDQPTAQIVVSAVLLVATGLAFALPWERLPGWLAVLVPLIYTGSVLALTLAAGTNSGVGIVVLVPLVWTALFHHRWESGCVVVAIVVVEVVTSVYQHADGPVTARRVVLWALLGVLMSVATHGLRDRIERAQAERAQLQDRIRDLTVLADRDRIARDLNERVIRRILTAGTTLQGTALLTGDGEVRRRLESTIDDLDQAARLLRQTIFGLGRDAAPTETQTEDQDQYS